jgi:hypothetical protein
VIAETAFGAEEEEEERESPYAKLLPPTEDQKARFEAVMADIHQRDGIKKTERAFTSAKEKNPPTPPPRNLPIRKRSVDLPLPPTPRDESGHFYESIRSTPPETLVSLQQPSAKRLKESPEENKPSLQPQKDPLFHHNEERSPFTPTRSMSRTSKMQSIFPPTPPDEQMSVKKQLDFNPQFNDLDARTLNALEESDIKLGKEASESLT